MDHIELGSRNVTCDESAVKAQTHVGNALLHPCAPKTQDQALVHKCECPESNGSSLSIRPVGASTS